MNPARNDPCACGSGKRYKHCCGAVIPIAAVVSPEPREIGATANGDRATVGNAAAGPIQPDPARSCGTCTACCDGWLTSSIRGHEMKVGVPCHFRGEGGCTIYEDRPADPCRGFYCAWRLLRNPFPESFRPDRLGVIILAKQWRERIAYYLVPAGREPDAALLEWLRRYSAASGTPFLAKIGGRERGYGSAEFQQDILEKATRGEPLLPGLIPGVGGPCKLVVPASP